MPEIVKHYPFREVLLNWADEGALGELLMLWLTKVCQRAIYNVGKHPASHRSSAALPFCNLKALISPANSLTLRCPLAAVSSSPQEITLLHLPFSDSSIKVQRLQFTIF
uniref:Uncharacterized protein n=1 Tax=Solanum lycopersicum TaxID=4081 RepID=A0A3Q7IVI6_SOLLC